MRIKGVWKGHQVWVDGCVLELEESQKVYSHNTREFSWGYPGSGPSQLALAILLKAVEPAVALKFYQHFKREIIADLPEDDFEIEIDIKLWIKKQELIQNHGNRFN